MCSKAMPKNIEKRKIDAKSRIIVVSYKMKEKYRNVGQRIQGCGYVT